ncbi:hypothetical protein ABT147_45030 [Streptomyces sp. NPDC001868]
MLTQDAIDYVVCEGHEDFVIAFTNGEVELVSVKPRVSCRIDTGKAAA